MSHQSVSSRICTLASGREALHRTRRVQPQLPGLMGLFKRGGNSQRGMDVRTPLSATKRLFLDHCIFFAAATEGRYESMHASQASGPTDRIINRCLQPLLGGSPLCRSAARWPSSLCHRCLFPASPAARSGVSGCACDDVSSRPSFSVHHCLPGSLRVSCRQVGVELEMKGRGHPPPVCPLRFGLSGPRDGLPPGGAINKLFPSH